MTTVQEGCDVGRCSEVALLGQLELEAVTDAASLVDAARLRAVAVRSELVHEVSTHLHIRAGGL